MAVTLSAGLVRALGHRFKSHKGNWQRKEVHSVIIGPVMQIQPFKLCRQYDARHS